MNPITFTNVIKTAQGANKYTSQFWVFAYNYTGTNNFIGLTVNWQLHTTMKIQYANGAWGFTCYPIYDTTNTATYTSFLTLPFNINTWNFVSCAVDLSGASGIYFISSDQALTPNPVGNLVPAVPAWPTLPTFTNLIITDSAIKDYGVLFFRQFRLWNNCYSDVIFLSRV